MSQPLSLKHFAIFATLAVVSASVLMPPVCHLLFKCGCSWLWTTAAAHCNVHKPTPPHCPWCSFGALGYYLPYAGLVCGQAAIGVLVFRFSGWLFVSALAAVGAILPVGYLMALVTLAFVKYPYLLFFR